MGEKLCEKKKAKFQSMKVRREQYKLQVHGAGGASENRRENRRSWVREWERGRCVFVASVPVTYVESSGVEVS